MKAIKQLYDMHLCVRNDKDWSDMTSLILHALSHDKGFMHKRVVDDGENMVNIYRDMTADFFLVVISTDMNKPNRGVNVNRYYIKPMFDEAKEYVYSGTLVKELMKDHGVETSIALAELREVLEEWQK